MNTEDYTPAQWWIALRDRFLARFEGGTLECVRLHGDDGLQLEGTHRKKRVSMVVTP